MDELDHLPRDYRLALAYAPKTRREDFAALFALDAQFARFVTDASEPVLAQMRLAWWRDRFAEPVADWPRGNPLLAHFSNWGSAVAGLGRMVDGWEALLGERPLAKAAVLAFAEGRAVGWLSLSQSVGERNTQPDIATAAQRHALVEIAWQWPEGADRAQALESARALPESRRLPSSLKPFGVLDALARRALAKDRAPLSHPSDLLTALREGLVGR